MTKYIAIWDWDYTLADTKAVVKAGAQDVMTHYGFPPVTDADVDNIMGSHRGAFWQDRFGAPDSPEMTAAIDLYLQKYRIHGDKVHLFPGAAETIRLLNDCGVKQILLSNKGESLLIEEVTAQGLFSEFAFIKGTRDALGKPDINFVLPILNQLNYEEILYIGDGKSDSDMAHNLGAPFILMHHNQDVLPHEYFCADFTALQHLLNTKLKG